MCDLAATAHFGDAVSVVIIADIEGETPRHWVHRASMIRPLCDLAEAWARPHGVPGDAVGFDIVGGLEVDVSKTPVVLGWRPGSTVRLSAFPKQQAYQNGYGTADGKTQPLKQAEDQQVGAPPPGVLQDRCPAEVSLGDLPPRPPPQAPPPPKRWRRMEQDEESPEPLPAPGAPAPLVATRGSPSQPLPLPLPPSAASSPAAKTRAGGKDRKGIGKRKAAEAPSSTPGSAKSGRRKEAADEKAAAEAARLAEEAEWEEEGDGEEADERDGAVCVGVFDADDFFNWEVAADEDEQPLQKTEAAQAAESDGNRLPPGRQASARNPATPKAKRAAAGKAAAAGTPVKAAKAKAKPTAKATVVKAASAAFAASAPDEVPGDEEAIVYVQANPKRDGGISHMRYEKYKKARTVKEAKALGASNSDISRDFKRGFMSRR